MRRKDLQDMIDKLCRDLGEHCNSVRVFATASVEDGTGDTAGLTAGVGDYYAQLGQVYEFITMEKQRQRNHITKEDSKDDESDSGEES